MAEIREGYPKLELGMTRDQVAALIGEPDYVHYECDVLRLIPKYLFCHWQYYIRKREDLVNLNDPVVSVFFDTNDRVDWITSNVTGFIDKGGPPNMHLIPTSQVDVQF